jgi:hypothetical protein
MHRLANAFLTAALLERLHNPIGPVLPVPLRVTLCKTATTHFQGEKVITHLSTQVFLRFTITSSSSSSRSWNRRFCLTRVRPLLPKFSDQHPTNEGLTVLGNIQWLNGQRGSEVKSSGSRPIAAERSAI